MVAGQPSLRIVLFIREPSGDMYQRVREVIASRGHRVIGVVTSPGPRTRRTTGYVDIVQQTPPSIDVIVSNHPDRWAEMLAPLKPDVILICGFSWKLPEAVLNLPRYGTYNTHNSLLPKYRGPFPLAFGWSFRNDDGEIGWTFHKADIGFDDGPILIQRSLPYGDDDDFESLLPRFMDLAIDEMMPEALDLIAAGAPLTPQSEEDAIDAVPFEDAWRSIDWNQPARSIHNQVRSWLGAGAIGLIDGVPTRVMKTRLVHGEHPHAASPGTVISRDHATITVQCGDGPLIVLRSQPEPLDTP